MTISGQTSGAEQTPQIGSTLINAHPTARANRRMFGAVTSQPLTLAGAENLRTRIHRGEVGPGDRLPAERALAQQLGVGRISLREAIKTLEQEGYVHVRWGASGGVYVSELTLPIERWRARMRTQDAQLDEIIDYRWSGPCAGGSVTALQ